MLRVGSYFKLLQYPLTGKLQPAAPLLFCNLFGRELLASLLDRRRGFFLLLFDRLAFPSTCHT